jgi:hypothetical protein
MILGLFSQKNLKINIDRKLRVFWSPIRTFKMCIASLILVTGSVNGSQNVYCVSDYCQSIRSESRRLDVKWHLYILPGNFLKVLIGDQNTRPWSSIH